LDTSAEIQIIPDQYMLRVISRVVSNLKKSIDCYFDARNLSLMLEILSANSQKIMELKSDGARLRCVTEISRENLPVCKEVMKYFELFHTSSLIGSFLVADEREYVGYLTTSKGEEKLLCIANPSFVGAQNFLVNTMIERALPASQRILEIGKGTEDEFIETIRDPFRVKSLISDLIRSAVYEIAILFSTKNSFLIAEREGILEEIGKVSAQGVKVKILVMQDETVKEISNIKLKALHQNVQVNYLQQLLPTRITTLLIDQAKALTIEVNDDTKRTFHEAVGLSTYSNSESTVFSNISMFESLWIQSELDKQNKSRQTYFKVFKGFKLKDEIYNRRWSPKDEKAKK
jgi:two-component system, OmpR family, sensor histidine kinase VicK